MGNLMVDAWQKDLADASPDKRIRAARELGNMGSSAKAALPALQKAAGDQNKDVAAAAKAAIASIGKK
jgi:HEAT repeat protein